MKSTDEIKASAFHLLDLLGNLGIQLTKNWSAHMIIPPNFNRNFVLALSILVVSACSSSSSNPTAADSPEMDTTTSSDETAETTEMELTVSLQDQLQNVVDQAVESGLPGVSLHFQHGDDSISVVAGVARRDTEEPVTPTSRFQIASIGKTYVATMFLRFADMGLLQLDDPIDTLLAPGMSAILNSSETITVEMLLAHTSGLPDYLAEADFNVDYFESQGRVWTPIEFLSYIGDRDNLFKPGKSFAYSNTNYLLLGVIAERVTGEPLGTALRQWVFQPAGLIESFGALEQQGQPELVHGYMPANFFVEANTEIDLPADGSDVDTIGWLSTYGFGDAPIQSTPRDMNLFIRTLIDTDVLVAGETKVRMLTESFSGFSQYGLGIVVVDNGTIFGHGGQHLGLIAELFYIPSKDISFATTINASDGVYNALFTEYLDKLITIVDDRIR